VSKYEDQITPPPHAVYLQVVVERRDLGAGVVEDVRDPGRVVEVGVEELEVLAHAVPRGHAAAQPVVVVHDAPAAGPSVVGPQQLTFGVVVEDVGAALAEVAVFVQPVLDVAQTRDAVPEVVAQRQDAGAVPRVEQVEVTVQVVAVAPRGPVIHLDGNKRGGQGEGCNSRLFYILNILF